VVTVHDGRAAMAASGLSKAQFFEQYGFVLLEHETAMEPHFWEQKEKLSQLYQPEIEKLVREQLELTEIIFESDGLSLTRGPKLPGATKENVKIYGQGIHSDYGLTGEQYTFRTREITKAQDEKGEFPDGPRDANRFDEMIQRDDIVGYTRLNFWRPIKPMQQPLKHMPMCYCDPNTVKKEDLVPCEVKGVPFNRGVTPRLIHTPEQRWYYFPDMSVNEVICFKVFEHMKSTPPPTDPSFKYPAVFHTAFPDPTMTKKSEKRNSAEFRPWIFHKKSKSFGCV